MSNSSFNKTQYPIVNEQDFQSSTDGVARCEFRRIVNHIDGIKMQVQPNGDTFLKSSGLWYRDIDTGKPIFWQRRLVCCVEPDMGNFFPFCDMSGNKIEGLTDTAGLVSFEPVFRSKACFSGVFIGIPKIGKYQDPAKKTISWTLVGFSKLPLTRSSENGMFVFNTDREFIYSMIKQSEGKAEGMKKGSCLSSNSPFLLSTNSPIINTELKREDPVIIKRNPSLMQDESEKRVNNGSSLMMESSSNLNSQPFTFRPTSPSCDMCDDDDESFNNPGLFDVSYTTLSGSGIWNERQMTTSDDSILKPVELSGLSESPFEQKELPSFTFGLESSSERPTTPSFPSQFSFQDSSSCHKDLMENMDDLYYIGYYPISESFNYYSSGILPQ